jgi:hypothetical protein
VSIYNSTITDAKGKYSGDLKQGGTLTLQNSILAYSHKYDGSPGIDVSRGVGQTLVIAGSNNLIMSGDNLADTIRLPPKLFPLENNGGGTLTQALFQDSPAPRAGANPKHVPFDQRGVSRGSPGFIDIGAFQQTDDIFLDGFDE